MNFDAMCEWLREQPFPATESQLRQKLLEKAELQPEAFNAREMQARFIVLGDALRALCAKDEFRRTGDLSTPALTQVERC